MLDAPGRQNFAADPEVPPILQEQGTRAGPGAAVLGGQYDALPASAVLVAAMATARRQRSRELLPAYRHAADEQQHSAGRPADHSSAT